MRVTFGTNSFNSDRYVGWTVGELLADDALAEVLNLSGNESVEVRSAGDRDFRTATNTYVVRESDEVQFFRSAGTKG